MSSSVSPRTTAAYASLRTCGPETRGGRYLRRFWHPIARINDLAVGQLQRVSLLGENLTLVRFSDGTHGLFGERCPHRGVPFYLGEVYGDTIRCPYHGWRYDRRGHNVEAPGEPDHRCTAATARVHPLAEAFGLLFAWLGDRTPPPLPFADALPPGMGPYRLAPIEWPTNFLLRLENTTDFSHLQRTHVGSGLAALLPPGYRQDHTPLPGGHRIKLTADSDPHQLLHALALGHPMTWHLPHFFHYRQPLLAGAPWRQHLTWHTPATDDQCRTFTVALVPTHDVQSFRAQHPEPGGSSTEVVALTETVLSGDRTLADLHGHPNLTEIEDCVMVVAQHRAGGGMPSVLGHTDVGVASIRRRLGRDVVASESDDWQSPWRPETLARLLVIDPG